MTGTTVRILWQICVANKNKVLFEDYAYSNCMCGNGNKSIDVDTEMIDNVNSFNDCLFPSRGIYP